MQLQEKDLTVRKPVYHSRRSLMGMPAEILLLIAKFVVKDFAPNGWLRKNSRWPTIEELRRQARNGQPMLSLLHVNRTLYRAGIDILYNINTIILTSAETVDLVAQPGLLNLVRSLRIRERYHTHSILVPGKCTVRENWRLLRKILAVRRLCHLEIDIEPFFVMFKETSGSYELRKDGLQSFLLSFGLHGVVKWSCVDLLTYVVVARSSLKSDNPVKKLELGKLVLTMHDVIGAYRDAVSEPRRHELERRPWLPQHGPFDPSWFWPRSTLAEIFRPIHTLEDWIMALLNDFDRIKEDLEEDDSEDVKEFAEVRMIDHQRWLVEMVPEGCFEGCADSLVSAGNFILGERCSRIYNHAWAVVLVEMHAEARKMALCEPAMIQHLWAKGMHLRR